MSMKILEMKNVKKAYDGFQLQIDLELFRGETIGLVGPNGAGKTTALGMVLNIVRKDSGEITVFGSDHVRHEAEIKEKIAVVLEEQNFYRKMKVGFYLKWCASFYPAWDWNVTDTLMNEFGLDRNKKYSELSKGMKVKLALISALSSGAEFFIFDEPTSGLDPQVRHDIIEKIIEMKKQRDVSMIFSSHNMSDIETLADRIVMLQRGEVIFNERKDALLEKWKRIEVAGCIDNKIFREEKALIRVSRCDQGNYFITNDYSEEMIARLKKYVAGEMQVAKMDLEEIFLCCTRNGVHNGSI